MLSLRSHAAAAVALVAVTPVAFVATQAVAAGSPGSTAAPQTSILTPTNTSSTPTPTPTPTTPPPTTTETATPTPTPTEEVIEPDAGWKPKSGVRFNDPRDPKVSHKINRYIRNAIINTPPGEKIRLVTWNYSNELFVRDVIAAHRRGVSVRLIMANGLAEGQSRQGYFGRTRDALAQGNKRRSNGMKSWARTCRNSCRAHEGIQHGKWFMFSHTGGVDKVVMSTSANLTDAAAANQWNDLLTVASRPVTWQNYNKIFKQMAKDQPVKRPYYTFDDGAYDGWFLPRPGKISNYNVVELLQKVKCRGARGDAGWKGRTVIRVSQSVFNGKPGSAVAGQLKRLHERGCKIKMIFGVLNNLARDRLKAIPKKTYLQDTNGDGFVDRYIHMKAMTISGNFDGRRSAHVVYQGSANWSGMSTLSDEQGFVVMSQKLEEKYRKWINWLYENPPPQDQDLVKYIELRRAAGHDPFALVREELGMGNMEPAL